MKKPLFFLLITSLLTCTSTTSAGPIFENGTVTGVLPPHATYSFVGKRVPHSHPKGITGLAAAHADRLVGMIHVSECQVAEAIQYFTYARMHDDSDEEIVQAPKRAGEILATYSNTWLLAAREAEKSLEIAEKKMRGDFSSALAYQTLLADIKLKYARAFTCNEHNDAALQGFLRVLSKEQSTNKR